MTDYVFFDFLLRLFGHDELALSIAEPESNNASVYLDAKYTVPIKMGNLLIKTAYK